MTFSIKQKLHEVLADLQPDPPVLEERIYQNILRTFEAESNGETIIPQGTAIIFSKEQIYLVSLVFLNRVLREISVNELRELLELPDFISTDIIINKITGYLSKAGEECSIRLSLKNKAIDLTIYYVTGRIKNITLTQLINDSL